MPSAPTTVSSLACSGHQRAAAGDDHQRDEVDRVPPAQQGVRREGERHQQTAGRHDREPRGRVRGRRRTGRAGQHRDARSSQQRRGESGAPRRPAPGRRPARQAPQRRRRPGRCPRSPVSSATPRLPPRPPSRARMIAAARSATSSLAKMVVRLLLTVLGERCSSRRSPAVRRPAASSSRISRSRAVSSGNGSAAPAAGGCGEVVEHPRGDARAEDRLAGGDGPDRAGDLVLLGALEQVAAGAGLHRGEHGGVVVVHREHQHGGVRAPPRGSGGSPRRRRARASGRPSARRRGAAAGPRGPPPRRRRPRRPPRSRRGCPSSARSPRRTTGWSSASSTRSGHLPIMAARRRPSDPGSSSRAVGTGREGPRGGCWCRRERVRSHGGTHPVHQHRQESPWKTCPDAQQKVGLVLAGMLSAINIPSVLIPTPDGEVGPPLR